MKTEYTEVRISGLTPYDKNTRRHSVRQVEEIQRSLKQFGQFRNIVVDDKNVILCGHGVVEAMKAEGIETARAYVLTGATEKQKAKLLLADNRTQDLGKDDFDAVEELIRYIDDTDIPGYDEESIKLLLMEADKDLTDAKQDMVDESREKQFSGGTEKEDSPGFLDQGSTAPEAAPEASVEDMETIQGVKPGNKVRVEYNKKILCPHCGEEIWF